MSESGSSFRRAPAIMISAAAMGVVTASIASLVHPVSAEAATPKYPSWSDVQHAKANVQAQQHMVDQINTLVGQLQSAATTAGIQAEIANEAYLQAQGDLQAATQTAQQAQQQADAAQKTAETSSVRAGLLASHLMRTAGTSGSMNLLLEGSDAGAADKLLYQLGTMSQLTEQSRRIYDQAIADRNTAKTAADQAKAAADARQKAADAAKQAETAASAAAAASQAAVTTQQQKQSELTAQLASLKNVSVTVAQQYVAGQQAIAAAKAAAAAAAAAAEKQREAAAARAAAAAAAQAQRERAAQAAQSQHAGGGNPGGGNTGGNTGGSGTAPSAPTAPTPPRTSSGASNQAIVNAAIQYAYAQIGKPYVMDGAGPNSFDCSGLTMMAYAYAGVNIGGHGVVYQYEQAAALGQLVPRADAQPGDLIFWGTAPYGLYHVGLYIGNGQMIAAPQPGENVKIEAVWGSPLNVVARPSMGR